jgi:regulator of cell morphogenesis and NO signaling
MNQPQAAPLPDVHDKTIGEFVAEDFRTAAVFEKYGIDFCCGGQVSLSSTCLEKNLAPAAIMREIEAVQTAPVERSQNYAAWDLSFLADYIVNTHHAYLNENTGQIAAYAHKIAEVHGAHHPEVVEIAAIFDQIAAALTDHLREEEEVLFPAIKGIVAAGKAGTTPEAEDRAPLKVALENLGQEHEEIGDATHAIRHLARDYKLPADVCHTFAITYQKLKEFEDDLHKHVHLENNILFPKAARL